MIKSDMEKGRRKLACVLWALLLTGLLTPSLTSLADNTSAEKLQNSIKQKQNAIGEAEKQKQALQSGLTDVKKLVEDLEKSKNDLKAYVAKLDANLDEIQKKIAELDRKSVV